MSIIKDEKCNGMAHIKRKSITVAEIIIAQQKGSLSYLGQEHVTLTVNDVKIAELYYKENKEEIDNDIERRI